MYLICKWLVTTKSCTVFIKKCCVLFCFSTIKPYNGIHILKLPIRPLVKCTVNYCVVVTGIDKENLVLDCICFSLVEEPQRTRQRLCVEEVISYADHCIYVACLYKAFTNIFIFSLAICCRRCHNKSCTSCFIQIAVEVGNPKVVTVSDFLIFVYSWHTERKTLCTFSRFSLNLIHIERRICHDIITATIKVMSIMIKAVCLVSGFNNTGKTMNSHIHKTELSIILNLFLSIEGHRAVSIHSSCINEVT